MITTLLTGKGGAGRTTIALNLAVASAAAGASTLLIDTDQNASIHQAFERRQLVASQFKLEPVDVRYSLSNLLLESLPVYMAKYDEIFIDTPVDINERIQRLVAVSDRVLVPIAAGYDDLLMTIEIANSLANLIARRPTLKANCFLNQWDDATQVSGTILRNLERLTDRLPLLSTVIHHNPDYANAFSYGVGAIEFLPSSTSAAEISALYAELKCHRLFN